MNTYYFHLTTPAQTSPDDFGVDFESAEDAYLDAYRAVLEMSVEMLNRREDPTHCRFEICDEEGRILFDLPFREVLQPAQSEPCARFSDLRAGLARNMERDARIRTQLGAGIREVREQIAAMHGTLRAFDS